MQAKLHEVDNWSDSSVTWIRCPPGLIPIIQLYDMEQDGTSRYTVTLGPIFVEDDPIINND